MGNVAAGLFLRPSPLDSNSEGVDDPGLARSALFRRRRSRVFWSTCFPPWGGTGYPFRERSARSADLPAGRGLAKRTPRGVRPSVGGGTDPTLPLSSGRRADHYRVFKGRRVLSR